MWRKKCYKYFGLKFRRISRWTAKSSNEKRLYTDKTGYEKNATGQQAYRNWM